MVKPDPSFLDPDLSAEARLLLSIGTVISADAMVRLLGIDKVVAADLEAALNVNIDAGAIKLLPADFPIPSSLLDIGRVFTGAVGEAAGAPSSTPAIRRDTDVAIAADAQAKLRDVIIMFLLSGYMMEKAAPALAAAAEAVAGIGAATGGVTPG